MNNTWPLLRQGRVRIEMGACVGPGSGIPVDNSYMVSYIWYLWLIPSHLRARYNILHIIAQSTVLNLELCGLGSDYVFISFKIVISLLSPQEEQKAWKQPYHWNATPPNKCLQVAFSPHAHGHFTQPCCVHWAPCIGIINQSCKQAIKAWT